MQSILPKLPLNEKNTIQRGKKSVNILKKCKIGTR